MTTLKVDRITKSRLRDWLNEPAGGSDQFLRATSPLGFGVRKFKGSNRAVFFAESRLGVRLANGKTRRVGKLRRVTLGDASPGALNRAVAEAEDVLAQLHQGKDVNAEKASQSVTAHIVGMSLNDALNYHIDAKRNRSFRPMADSTEEDMRRVFTKHLSTKLLHRPVLTLQTNELQEAIERIATASNRAKARRYLSAVIESSYAVMNSDRPNPMRRVKNVGEALKGRTTYLPFGEAQKVWQWLNSDEVADYSDRLRTAFNLIRFVMLSGARRDEAVDLEWSAIGAWGQQIVRLFDTKNKTTHFIPITPGIKTVLKDAFNGSKQGPVFAGTSGRGKVTTQAITEAIGVVCDRTKVHLMDEEFNHIHQPFVLHDLRRTIATALVNYLGVEPGRVSRVLNHRKVDRDGAASTELYIQVNPALIEPELIKYENWLSGDEENNWLFNELEAMPQANASNPVH